LSLEPIPEFKVFDQVSVSVINFFFFVVDTPIK
jgi:hypothetical protein